MEIITAELTPWHWLTIGVLFFALELFAPTTFLLWPAIAAILTGLVTWLIPMSWHFQLVLFAVLAVSAIIVGRHFFKNRTGKESTDPTLNRRGESVKGRIITLSEPIVNGVGSAMIDNTRWRLVGPDLPAGSKLQVVGTEGSSLTVELLDD